MLAQMCAVFEKVDMTKDTEVASALMNKEPFLRTQSYKVQLTMGLPRVPWKLINAILAIGAGTNVFFEDKTFHFYGNGIGILKPRRL